MALDSTDVKNIAFLARIKVPDEELPPLAEELSGILRFVEQLAEVDTENVEPMTSVAEMDLHWRQDVVSDGNYRDRVLANAPEVVDGFFAVPKVVE